MKFRAALLALILVFSTHSATATHAYGGQITWKCFSTGPFAGRYKFYLTLYRDCGTGTATLPNSVAISSNSSVGSISLFKVGINSDVSPSCYLSPSPVRCNQVATGLGALEEARYESGYILLSGSPPPTGWTFSYSLCCRPASLSNIQNPASANLHLQAVMYPYSVNGAPQSAGSCYDSSPEFLEYPKSATCTGSKFSYSQSAFDSDFDSLHYEWTDLLTFNAVPIPFVTPYSVTNQLPNGTTPATLDPNTGTIQFTPQAGGAFATAIKVSSYRCGQLISQIFRDIPIVVRSDCPNVPTGAVNAAPSVTVGALPGFPPITPVIVGNDTLRYVITVNAGEQVKFNFTGNDGQILANFQPQSITFTGLGGNFGSPIGSAVGCGLPPCATVTPVVPQSSLTSAVQNEVQFNWQTLCDHLVVNSSCPREMVPYSFVLRMSDNHCPIPATRLINVIVNVKVPMIDPPVVNASSVTVLSNGNVQLNWLSPADTGISFDGYVVMHSPVANGPFVALDTLTSYSAQSYLHTSPIQGINYYLLRTLSKCGQISEPVDTLKTIWLAASSPSAVDTSTVDLSWNSPVSNYIGYYQIMRRKGAGSAWVNVDSTLGLSYRDSVYNCGSNYTYRVLTNLGSASSSVSTWFADKLNTELHDIDSSYLTFNSIWFSWNPGLASDLAQYQVFRSDSTLVWQVVTSVPSSVTSYVIPSRSLYANEFRVVSVDSCGNVSSLANTQGLIVQGTLGTEVQSTSWALVPNPTRGILHTTVPVDGTYEVRTTEGKVVRRGTLPGPVDLKDLPSGILLVQIQTDRETRRFQVVKTD